MTANSQRVTITHLLVPVSLMAFVMTLFFAFQMSLVLRDRASLQQTFERQEPLIQQSQKLNAQFGGLVMGVQKLSEEGNKTALFLADRLRQVGVIPPQQNAGAAPKPQVPAAIPPAPSSGPAKP